jgi:hypothetical protein
MEKSDGPSLFRCYWSRGRIGCSLPLRTRVSSSSAVEKTSLPTYVAVVVLFSKQPVLKLEKKASHFLTFNRPIDRPRHLVYLPQRREPETPDILHSIGETI